MFFYFGGEKKNNKWSSYGGRAGVVELGPEAFDKIDLAGLEQWAERVIKRERERERVKNEILLRTGTRKGLREGITWWTCKTSRAPTCLSFATWQHVVPSLHSCGYFVPLSPDTHFASIIGYSPPSLGYDPPLTCNALSLQHTRSNFVNKF